jgi:transposase-like protein
MFSTRAAQGQAYERTEERQGYRNGYRDKVLKPRVGELTLMVPRLRSGHFSTELFERYQRSEQALLLAQESRWSSFERIHQEGAGGC